MSNNFKLFWNEIFLALSLKIFNINNDKGRGSFPTHADKIAPEQGLMKKAEDQSLSSFFRL